MFNIFDIYHREHRSAEYAKKIKNTFEEEVKMETSQFCYKVFRKAQTKSLDFKLVIIVTICIDAHD